MSLLGTFFRKLFSPVIWVNLLAMVAVVVGVLIGVKVWLDSYTHHGQQIEVPDVTGKLPLEASGALQMRNLRAEIADSTYNPSLPAGVVLSQRPAAGSLVKEGRTIGLTINTLTVPTIALPDIAGNCSVREAQERLMNLGFKLDAVQYVDGDPGWVYGMKCEEREVYNGQKLPEGSIIVLLVGGKDPNDSLAAERAHAEGDIYDYD